MKQEQVLQWARAAELIDPRDRAEDPYVIHMLPLLLRFAQLVAAHEREQCAQVCEGFPENRDWVPGSLWGNIRCEMGAAIRSRGKEATCN